MRKPVLRLLQIRNTESAANVVADNIIILDGQPLLLGAQFLTLGA